MRYLKVIVYCVIAALVFAWVSTQWDEAARQTRKREARATAIRSWNQCSLKIAKLSMEAHPERAAVDIVPVILTECRSQYQARLVTEPDQDETRLNAELLKRITREVAAYRDEQEEERKAELIEAAIREMKKQGVTEEDLKNYSRESILEEVRPSILEEDRN